MKSSIEFFDPILLGNMTAAFDAVLARCMPTHADSPDHRIALGRLILNSARNGERDQQQLELSASIRLPDATLGARLPQAHRSSS